MRIFYVCGDPGIPPDGTKGASVHFRSLMAALEALGHEVIALTRRLPLDPHAATQTHLPLDSAASIVDAARGGRRPDVILERYALGHEAGLESARALRVPFALEVNAPLVEEAARHRRGEPGEGAAAERRLFREADLVFVVSRPLREYVAAIRGSTESVEILWNGCDPELFAEGRAPLARTRPLLGFLGNPKPWHGADSLPPLLVSLRDSGLDAGLRIVGGGPGAESIRSAAGALGVADRVEITGSLPQLEAVRRFRECSVALAPYPDDPFFYFCPLKVIESMAAGLPLVATRVGDLPEMVGDAALLVPPGDPEALARAVRDLLLDADRRRSLGERARARALDRFTWARTARTLVDRIRERIGPREAVS